MQSSNNRRDVLAMGVSSAAAGAVMAAAAGAQAGSSARGRDGAGRPAGAPAGKVLVVGSSAHTLRLRGGRIFPTGNYLNEMIVPMQALRAAGYEIIVATPAGEKPPLDERSVVASHFGGDQRAFTEAMRFYQQDPAFHQVRTLAAMAASGLEGVDGVFVPGGHAPIVDLAVNPDLGRILHLAHARGLPTALLCHGPIALLAATADAPAFTAALEAGDSVAASAALGDWPYRGYRMTIFSRSEEQPVERTVFGALLPYVVADALSVAGGQVEHGEADYGAFMVSDRELITGQNPRSDHLVATRLVEALNARAHA